MADTKHDSIIAALAAFQAEVPTIAKGRTAKITSTKGSYSYKYAALEDIMAAIRPVLAKHGLAITQNAVSENGNVGVSTTIHHGTEAIESGVLLLPAGGTPQSAGSALTYARRYSLSAALGIATEEDDDAAGATQSVQSTGSRDRNTASSGSSAQRDEAGNDASAARGGSAPGNHFATQEDAAAWLESVKEVAKQTSEGCEDRVRAYLKKSGTSLAALTEDVVKTAMEIARGELECTDV